MLNLNYKVLFIFSLLLYSLNAQRSNNTYSNFENYSDNHEKDILSTYESPNSTNEFFKLTKRSAKKSIRSSAAKSLNANTFINGLNIAWINYGRDTGVDPFTGDQYHPDIKGFREVLEFTKNNGGNLVRWWYHTNGSTNPVYNDKQEVTTNPSFFHDDVVSILDLAESIGIKVQICLWSFDMLKDQWGVDANANKKLLTQDVYMNAYLNNALRPLVKAVGNHPALYAWEIFNEPEGMTNQYAKHWKGFKERVTMNDIQKFINKATAVIRKEQPNIPITNGALGMLTNTNDSTRKFWNAYSDENLIKAGGEKTGYLDFYNLHYYKWARSKGSPFHNKYNSNQIDKPTVIGEYYPDDLKFDYKNGDQDHNLPTIKADQLGKKIKDNNWAGSITWSWTDRKSTDERNRIKNIIKNAKPHDSVNDEVKETVTFNETISSLEPQLNYTFSIDYTASENREVVVELWSSNTWIAGNFNRVEATNNNTNITITLNELPPNGNEYYIKYQIRPLNSTWKEAFEIKESNRFEIKDKTPVIQEVTSVSIDNKILDRTLSYTFDVNYTANQQRELVLEFWSTNLGWIAENMVVVNSGSGTQSIEIKLNKLLNYNTEYFIKAYIRPLGTTWRESIFRVEDYGYKIPNDAAQTENLVVKNGIYFITNAKQNQRLTSVKFGNQNNVVNQNPNTKNQQRWLFNHLGNNIYTIKNIGTNQFIEVRGALCENRSNITTWQSANDEHQKWKVIKTESNSFQFIPQHCQSMALDIAGGLVDGNIQLWQHSTTNQNQNWEIKSVNGAKELEKNLNTIPTISIFPNPVINFATINGVTPNENIVITNLNGEIILKTKANNDTKIQLDFSSFENGAYIIYISRFKHTLFYKI